MTQKQGTIFIIADGTGETAATMIRAALVQYQDTDINIVRSKNIRTEAQVESIIADAVEARGIIIHTVVSPHLRQLIQEHAAAKGLPSVDLIGPLLQSLDQYFGVAAGGNKSVGILRMVDERYFKRVEAI